MPSKTVDARWADVPEQDPDLKVEVHYDTRPDQPNAITMYMHCGLCLAEWKAEHRGTMSPAEYARTQAGITADGLIQVWCNRHEVTVATLLPVARRREVGDGRV